MQYKFDYNIDKKIVLDTSELYCIGHYNLFA